MLDFRIVLEARNPARRCSRHYRVEAGTDLFGSWVVEITYGRIGGTDPRRDFPHYPSPGTAGRPPSWD